MSKPILLVHGAFHGAWCWRPVVAALAARGRRGIAIDLPGAGEDPADPATTTFDDYTNCIINAASAIGEPVVLAGHSLGGMSITLAAEQAPGLFASMVYIAAFVPGHQQSAAELTSAQDVRSELEVVASADGRLFNAPAAEMARAAFYHDCPEPLVTGALPRLRPIAISFIVSPVQLPEYRARTLPRHYIECTQDRAIPIAAQRQMVSAHLPITIHSLESGHSPFLSMPEKLADILAEIA